MSRCRPRFVVRVVHGNRSPSPRSAENPPNATAHVMDTWDAWRVVAYERTESREGENGPQDRQRRTVEQVTADAQAKADALNVICGRSAAA